jgi:hypothetical protein
VGPVPEPVTITILEKVIHLSQDAAEGTEIKEPVVVVVLEVLA